MTVFPLSPRLQATFTLVALTTALPAAAAVVTTLPANIDARVLTFSAYDNVTAFTQVPDALPGIDVGTAELGEVVRLTSNETADRILGANTQAFGSNGSWPVNGGYAGLNSGDGSLRFTFAQGMDFVGGRFNYRAGTDATVSVQALDIDNNAIELEVLSFDAGDSTVVGYSRFIGFTSASSAIYSLQINGGYVALDDLTFGNARTGNDVPEPAALGLALAGLGLLAATRRRASPRQG